MYKIVATRGRYETTEPDAKRQKVAEVIDPELKDIISKLKGFDAERLNLIKTLAVGLTAWIKDGIEGEKRLGAAKRILNCYLAQLEEKIDDIDETAIELDLSQLGLKSLPPEIGKLTNLEYLYLDDNQLTSVEGVGKLTSLTVLGLANNQLISLPTEIGKLTNLTMLELSNNQLTSVEGVEKLTSLTVLCLANNQLTSVKGVEKLTNLRELYLFKNQLTSVEGVGKLTNLTKLSLANNQLTSVEGVGQLKNLEMLWLNNNQLTSVEGVGKLTNLRILWLANNQLTSLPDSITNVGIEYLGLTEVHLENNPLPDNVLTRLREASNDRLRFQVSIQERPCLASFETLEDATRFWEERPGQLQFNRYDEYQKERLKEFLSQLRSSAEYKNDHTRAGFKSRVVAVLTEISKNEKDVELYVEAISNALTNCTDRTSVGFNEIEMRVREAKLIQAAIETEDINSEASKALKAYHESLLRYEQLEKYIANKMATMRFVDEIEVWLYYMTKLKETLNLPTQISEMLYEDFAEGPLRLSEEDIEQAKKFVADEIAKIDSGEALSDWKPWQQVDRADQWRQFDFATLGTQSIEPTEKDALTDESVLHLDAFVLPKGQVLLETSLKKCWISNGQDPFTKETILLAEIKKGLPPRGV